MLHVQGPELLSLVELILSEAETRSQDGDSAARTLIQTRLPLLLSCCRSNDESIGKVTEHLTSCIQQWGDSVLGQRCRDLLLQLYLQRPEVRVPVPEVLLHSEGATSSSICKVRDTASTERGWGWGLCQQPHLTLSRQSLGTCPGCSLVQRDAPPPSVLRLWADRSRHMCYM